MEKSENMFVKKKSQRDNIHNYIIPYTQINKRDSRPSKLMGSRVITNNFTKEIQVDNRNENMIIVIGDQQFRSKLARGREEEEVKKIEFLI